MDPQQRLLLESGYEATHDAGLQCSELLGDDFGIFAGLIPIAFTSLAGSTSVYAATLLKHHASYVRLRGAGLGSLVEANKTICAESSLLCRGHAQLRLATHIDLPLLLELCDLHDEHNSLVYWAFQS